MSSSYHFSSSIFLLHSQLLYLPNPKQHTRDGEWGMGVVVISEHFIPTTASSLNFPPSSSWFFSMGYSPPETNCPGVGPHGPRFLPETLLLHEHISLLQLKLSTGCSWVCHRGTGYFTGASSVDYVGLSSFPLLGSSGFLTFVSFLSLAAAQPFLPCPKYSVTEWWEWGSALGSTGSILEPAKSDCAQNRESLSLLTVSSHRGHL